MILQQLGDLLLLLLLGLMGWLILAKLRVPASEIIGPVLLIGALRAAQVDLPLSPAFLFPAVQVVIGIFVGSMLNREAVRELKQMVLPAGIIVSWALSAVFFIGIFLERFSALDLYTALLSASMGGLPEISVIALASGASVAIIMVMQLMRLLGTVFVFPLLLKWLVKREPAADGKLQSETTLPAEGEGSTSNSRMAAPEMEFDSGGNLTANHNRISGEEENAGINGGPAASPGDSQRFILARAFRLFAGHINRTKARRFLRVIAYSWKKILFTGVVAAAGGILFESLRVPAGLLVGSTIFVGVCSVTGLPVSRFSPRLLDILLVVIGINVADNISLQAVSTMVNPTFLVPLFIATMVLFSSSFAVAWIIHRITGWDYPTSFLASAPSGFTIMTALAIKHNRDPIRVSMLHLCRLLSINIFVPFIFIILMNR